MRLRFCFRFRVPFSSFNDDDDDDDDICAPLPMAGKHVAAYYGNYWHMCRPRMVELRYTDGATINNITIQNSIMFNVHTAHVNKLRIANVTVHSLGPNTDGFNVAGMCARCEDPPPPYTKPQPHFTVKSPRVYAGLVDVDVGASA